MTQRSILLGCLIVGSLWGLSVEWIDSYILKVLIGALYGLAIGVLAYNDKCNVTIMYLVSGLSVTLFAVAGIIGYVLSDTATFGSFILMVFIIPSILFWAFTRT